MNNRTMIRVGLALTAFMSLACVGPAKAIDGADIPPAGLYWRSPLPNTLGELNFALGSTVQMQAALVDLARVDRVVYFAGGSQVGQVTNPPYAFDWTAAGNGEVVLRAEARTSGGTVQGWCERTIQVVGDGLRVAQREIVVSVPTGGSTTVTLDLTNLGPSDTEWALHVQGGTAPGGTNGRIVKTFASGTTLFGAFTYRHGGTTNIADDEFWLKDATALGDYKLRRRRVSDWADLGVFEKTDGDKISSYCQFDAEGDRYWSYHTVGSVQGFSLVDVATKSTRRSIQLDGVPYLAPSFAVTANPNGVLYTINTDTSGPVWEKALWQARSRDGRLIASHGNPPSLPSIMHFYSPKQVCWKDGYLWIFEHTETSPSKSVKLWRWTPGMADVVEVVSWTTSSSIYHGSSGICPAAEPGFLWVFTSANADYRVQRVDTGYRPWLLPVTSTGTLANGASQTVTVQINASTAPAGTYSGVLALTQYPNALIPQITVPVTLTVTSGVAPLDADGDGMLDSWENTYLGGTNASPTADADLDGMSNLNEYLAGTNPTNIVSVLAMSRAAVGSGLPGGFVVSWQSASNKLYTLQAASNLVTGFTLPLGSNIPATYPVNVYTDNLNTARQKFYRVKVQVP